MTRRRDGARGASLLAGAILIFRKDLVVELRSREVLSIMAVFGALVVLVFGFAFVREGQVTADVAAGVLWSAITFAGTLGLGRVHDRERENDTFRALLVSPLPRNAVYAGKLLTIVALMLASEVVVVPLVGLLFDAPIVARPGMLAALLLSGTVGFAAVGSLLSALLLGSRSRDLLLAIGLLPLVVPVIVAGVLGTSALWQAVPSDTTARTWLGVLVAFDATFVTSALWLFEPLVSD